MAGARKRHMIGGQESSGGRRVRRRWPWTHVLLLHLGLFHAVFAAASEPAWIVGTVADSASGAPIPQVLIRAIAHARDGAPASGPVATSVSSEAGAYRLGPLPGGKYDLLVSRLGYRSRVIAVAVDSGMVLTVAIALTLAPVSLPEVPVVVSASRVRQRILDAPVSTTVIGAREIRERTALTPIGYVRDVAAVDVSTKGLIQQSVVVRGFNSTQSSDLLTLVDGRYANLPSFGYNVYHFIPTSNDDIERVEIVRGPAAALYGPGSERGVLQIITKSPFDSRGTTVEITGGNRSIAQGSARHAGVLGTRLGYRLSAQYLRGDDWPFTDPIESGARANAIALGANPETLRIGQRDPVVERAAVDARVEWRAKEKTTATFGAGFNRALRNVDQTAVGAVQVRGYRAGYAQVVLDRGLFHGQAFVNATDAGESYFLRSGDSFVDKSSLMAGQMQHGQRLGRHAITYGLDYRRTIPRTGGIITGRNEADDEINEVGGYLQADLRLSPLWRGVVAARVDHHDRFSGTQFSPRGALVFQPRPEHSLRVTYNRGFWTPTVDELLSDLELGSLPFGYELRVEGVPSSGFSFRREGDVLLMRSPFTSDSMGGSDAYLRADATLLWESLADTLRARGQDIDSIPKPDGSQVPSTLRIFNPDTQEFDVVEEVSDLPALRPRSTDTVEVGYRGSIGTWMTLTADVYRSWVHNFAGHLRVITPNVFYDESALAAYLGQYMSASNAATLAALIASIPMGTVTPEEARDSYDLILAVRNFGEVKLWGADFGVLVPIVNHLAAHASYSWVSEDFFANLDGIEDVALNAPRHKGSVRLHYRNEMNGVMAELRGRFMAGFPFRSGVYVGEIPGYGLLDAGLGYALGPGGRLSAYLTAENLLAHHHQEMVGAPRIGRILMARIQRRF